MKWNTTCDGGQLETRYPPASMLFLFFAPTLQLNVCQRDLLHDLLQ